MSNRFVSDYTHMSGIRDIPDAALKHFFKTVELI